MDFKSKRRALALLVAFTVVFSFGAAFAFAAGGLEFGGHVSIDSALLVGIADVEIVESRTQLHGGEMLELSPLAGQSFDGFWGEVAATTDGIDAVQRFNFQNRGYVIVRYTLRNNGTIPAVLHFVGPERAVESMSSSFGMATFGMAEVEHNMAFTREELSLGNPVAHSPYFAMAHSAFGLDLQNAPLPVGGTKSFYVKVSYMLDYEKLMEMFWQNPMLFMGIMESHHLLQQDIPSWEMVIRYSMATR